ncbi:hydrogen peroxide-dependent heme synthase [Leifsonia shinshuensis]
MSNPAPRTTDQANAFEVSGGFALWAVLRQAPVRVDHLVGADVSNVVEELERVIAELGREGVTTRGLYDVSGLRADADIMIWLHGPDAEGLQWGLRQLRATRLFRRLLPTWNAMAVHREAEFNKTHVPGFLRGNAPKAWLTVYSFVRSREWYLLTAEERGRMLAEHGRKGAAFRFVLANTAASFALGDYEWILAFESDQLTDLVDLMRDLRQTEARRHVREEVPFFTGRRVEPAHVVEILH